MHVATRPFRLCGTRARPCLYGLRPAAPSELLPAAITLKRCLHRAVLRLHRQPLRTDARWRGGVAAGNAAASVCVAVFVYTGRPRYSCGNRFLRDNAATRVHARDAVGRSWYGHALISFRAPCCCIAFRTAALRFAAVGATHAAQCALRCAVSASLSPLLHAHSGSAPPACKSPPRPHTHAADRCRVHGTRLRSATVRMRTCARVQAHGRDAARGGGALVP
jgi:hypothetical protein